MSSEKLPLLGLDGITIEYGSHPSRDDGVCAMEAVAWIAGECHTDHPKCVSPVLGAFLRSWNDKLDAPGRQRLKPFLPRVIGTAGDGRDERRGWLCMDWLVRTFTPAWLELAGVTESAQALRALPPFTSSSAVAKAEPAISAAHRAAYSVADSAARSEARSAAHRAAYSAADSAAYSAAHSAARSAARSVADSAAHSAACSAARSVADSAAYSAARSAAYSAACSAARSAAHSAAYSAACSAARSAARSVADRAAHRAAYSAADSALEPTMQGLQASALELLEALIHA